MTTNTMPTIPKTDASTRRRHRGVGTGGIVLHNIGYYLWELITPYNVRKELQENKNVAVAIVVASFILGMAIVIAASLILIK